MPAEFTLGWLEPEMVWAVHEEVDARDVSRPLNRLFVTKGTMAEQIGVRTHTRRPTQSRLTTPDGQAVPVNVGTMKEVFYEPAWLKKFIPYTESDMTAFLRAFEAEAAGQISGRGGNEIANARDRARKGMEYLVEDVLEFRSHMCTIACVGTGEILHYDQRTPETVSYGLQALTNPSILWDDADAVVFSDIEALREEFVTNNPWGLEPTHALHPRGLAGLLALNTQWIERTKYSPQLNEGLLRIPGGRNPFRMDGDIAPGLGGLTWVKMQGKYMRDTGTALTLTDRWPANQVTLLRLPEAGPTWMTRTNTLLQPGTRPNYEIENPVYGNPIKNTTLIGMHNGLGVWERPQLVQTFNIAA